MGSINQDASNDLDLALKVMGLEAQVSLLQRAIRLYERDVCPYASSWFKLVLMGEKWRHTTPEKEAEWDRVRLTIEEAKAAK